MAYALCQDNTGLYHLDSRLVLADHLNDSGMYLVQARTGCGNVHNISERYGEIALQKINKETEIWRAAYNKALAIEKWIDTVSEKFEGRYQDLVIYKDGTWLVRQKNEWRIVHLRERIAVYRRIVKWLKEF